MGQIYRTLLLTETRIDKHNRRIIKAFATAWCSMESEVLACRTIYRVWTIQCFKLSVEPDRPSFASSAKSLIA
ncbi:hypothetical protein M405DRAFT_413940 [Rhizopogon salebrosus TDB-379]|nr:hypothetical protein M405DRAFT_413940 [Rhizopogon salebrosus TDB-379]